MKRLQELLAEQKERHQGGSKWIGTAGTSPFGAYGYNPEGVRIGQDKSRNRSAVKVWDRREFKDLDDTVELGTRGMKLALRRLRRFARQGAATELDLPDTIKSTANNAGNAGPETGAGAAQHGQGAAVPGHRRLHGRLRQADRGVVLRRALRVQAPGALLLPQLSRTSASGRTTAAATRNRSRRGRCCGPTAPTTSSFSSATAP